MPRISCLLRGAEPSIIMLINMLSLAISMLILPTMLMLINTLVLAIVITTTISTIISTLIRTVIRVTCNAIVLRTIRRTKDTYNKLQTLHYAITCKQVQPHIRKQDSL